MDVTEKVVTVLKPGARWRRTAQTLGGDGGKDWPLSQRYNRHCRPGPHSSAQFYLLLTRDSAQWQRGRSSRPAAADRVESLCHLVGKCPTHNTRRSAEANASAGNQHCSTCGRSRAREWLQHVMERTRQDCSESTFSGECPMAWGYRRHRTLLHLQAQLQH
jgi:hypothetical protein